MAEPLPLLLLGAGGHARSVIDVIEQSGEYAVLGLVDRAVQVGQPCLGYPVLGTDDDLPALLAGCPHAFVAVGQVRDASIRRRLHEQLLRLGARLPVVRAPGSVLSRHARVGSGTFIGHGAIINAGAMVGDNVIVNSRALVEHDAEVGSHCHVATGAIVNGGAVIEDGCFVGSGAIIRDGIRVGAGSFIGAGALVARDCPAGSLVKRSS